MPRTTFSRVSLFAIAVFALAGPASIRDADAGRGGGGRGGGGGRSFGGGGARTSVNRGYSGSYSGNRSANVNRDVNRDVGRDRDINGDRGYYRGGRYYGGAPIARAAVAGTAVAVGAVAIGSTYYSLPTDCVTVADDDGATYYQCGSDYYAPSYYGDQLSYTVVEEP